MRLTILRMEQLQKWTIQKKIIDKSELEFNNINNSMKDKTLNGINYIKNGTITKIKNVKKYMIDKSELEFNNVKNKAINDIDNVGDEFKKSGSEFESTFKKVGYEILDGVISAGDTGKQNIFYQLHKLFKMD